MNKNLVTESADMLCKKAEKDILSIDSLISAPKYPVDYFYDIICFHATQAVEKLLKSFIIHNNRTVEKIHNLDMLHKIVTEVNTEPEKNPEN